MKQIKIFYAYYFDGRVVRYTSLIFPLLIMNKSIRYIKDSRGTIVWEYDWKKPTT